MIAGLLDVLAIMFLIIKLPIGIILLAFNNLGQIPWGIV